MPRENATNVSPLCGDTSISNKARRNRTSLVWEGISPRTNNRRSHRELGGKRMSTCMLWSAERTVSKIKLLNSSLSLTPHTEILLWHCRLAATGCWCPCFGCGSWSLLQCYFCPGCPSICSKCKVKKKGTQNRRRWPPSSLSGIKKFLFAEISNNWNPIARPNMFKSHCSLIS